MMPSSLGWLAHVEHSDVSERVAEGFRSPFGSEAA
jgi:hypothetical protein